MSDHSKKRQWTMEYNKLKTITVWYPVVAHGLTQLTTCMKIRQLILD